MIPQEIDQDVLSCYSKTYQYFKRFLSVFTAFMYMVLIIFPSVTEIIAITQQDNQQKIYTLITCAIIQIIISIYGGIKLGTDWYKSKSIPDQHNTICRNIWCGSFTDYNSLFSAGYIIYMLPQWWLTNAIIAWVLSGNNIILPFYVHLMIYIPLLIYCPIVFMGYAFAKTAENEYSIIV